MTPKLEIVYRPLAWFKPYERNPRKNDQAVDRMVASIIEFGFAIPVLCQSSGVVVDGHLRLKAGARMTLEEIPVILCDNWSDAQVKAFRLMANRSVGWAEWDADALASEFADLKAVDFDLGLTGFDSAEIDGFLLHEETAPEEEIPEAPANPVSRAGDLWLLGDHRLLCGDSTDNEAVSHLMSKQKADLVFIDPPYNVDYEGYTEEKLTIKSDKMTPAAFLAFLEKAFRSVRLLLKDTAALYVCHSSSWQREFQNALEAAGFNVRCQIIWAKNTFAWGFGRYKFQHEPIFYCHVAGQSDAWYGDKSQSTLWEVNKPSANREHPTMKPVELVRRALVNSSERGDLVVDLFGGTGSTLIAAHAADRVCYTAELDPKYADVIVLRWQALSGKTATLGFDGSSFQEAEECRQPAA